MTDPAPDAPTDDVRRLDRDRDEEGRPENARPRDRFGAPLSRDAEDEMPDRVEPEDVCTEVGQAVEAAVGLFDAQRFFEAHEFFEWAWKGPVTPEGDRQLFKGLAQVAVGYCHTQRGNATGAASLLERGVDNLAPYGDTSHGIDLARVAADATAFRAALPERGVGPDQPFPSMPLAEGGGSDGTG